MSGLVEAALVEANAYLGKARADLEEARALANGAPLVEILQFRVERMEEELRAFNELPTVADATRAYSDALGVHMRAASAHEKGSTDRAKALALAEDHEHAKQCLRIAKRRVEEAEKSKAPLDRIIKLGRNEIAKNEARGLIESLATQALRGRDEVTVRHDVSLDVAAWEAFFAARELASYDAKRRSAGVEAAKAWSKEQLASALATRQANHDARRAGAVCVNGEWVHRDGKKVAS